MSEYHRHRVGVQLESCQGKCDLGALEIRRRQTEAQSESYRAMCAPVRDLMNVSGNQGRWVLVPDQENVLETHHQMGALLWAYQAMCVPVGDQTKV